MRRVLKQETLASKKGIPKGHEDLKTRDLFDEIAELAINKTVIRLEFDAVNHSSDFKTIRKEVKDQNVRDQYYREEIYKVGEWASTRKDHVGKIIRRGPNYLICLSCARRYKVPYMGQGR